MNKKPISPDNIAVAERTEALKAVALFKPRISNLIVTSQEEYIAADALLGEITANIALREERMSKIIGPLDESMKLAKKALASAKDLLSEVTGPLLDFQLQVKERMRAFKLEEIRQLRAAEEKRQEEARQLEEQARAKDQALLKAKTPAMQSKILEHKARLEQALADKRAEQAPVAVKAQGSTARVERKYRVTDKHALIKYLIENATETNGFLSLVDINPGQMQALFRLDKPVVGEWMPGMEVYEDVNIARK